MTYNNYDYIYKHNRYTNTVGQFGQQHQAMVYFHFKNRFKNRQIYAYAYIYKGKKQLEVTRADAKDIDWSTFT